MPDSGAIFQVSPDLPEIYRYGLDVFYYLSTLRTYAIISFFVWPSLLRISCFHAKNTHASSRISTFSCRTSHELRIFLFLLICSDFCALF